MMRLMIITLLTFSLSISILNGQAKSTENVAKNYNDCAAIFFKGNMLVNEYSPKGICKLEEGMKGDLTLHTVSLSDQGGKPTSDLTFQIAIKHVETNTIRMYSSEIFRSIPFHSILKKCNPGENILILTTDPKYALTHHEILINW